MIHSTDWNSILDEMVELGKVTVWWCSRCRGGVSDSGGFLEIRAVGLREDGIWFSKIFVWDVFIYCRRWKENVNVLETGNEHSNRLTGSISLSLVNALDKQPLVITMWWSIDGWNTINVHLEVDDDQEGTSLDNISRMNFEDLTHD